MPLNNDADATQDELVQLIAPNGERRSNAAYDRWVSDVDGAALQAL